MSRNSAHKTETIPKRKIMVKKTMNETRNKTVEETEITQNGTSKIMQNQHGNMKYLQGRRKIIPRQCRNLKTSNTSELRVKGLVNRQTEIHTTRRLNEVKERGK